MATAQGTFDYKERHDGFARTYFRRVGDRAVSSIGLGTYLGDPDDETDDAYREAIQLALESGVNVVDTAINYRHQRSERVVGEALAESDVPREAVFVATKGGFLPFDGDRPDDPGDPGRVPRPRHPGPRGPRARESRELAVLHPRPALPVPRQPRPRHRRPVLRPQPRDPARRAVPG